MRIPSYDDLTPSIPDITPRDTLAHVARILPACGASIRNASWTSADRPPRGDAEASASPAAAQLFACLRSTRAADAIVAIARDFSPRLERHGRACVVLDVSGLGRLLGDPQAIGSELDRAAAAAVQHGRATSAGESVRVAVAPTQTAARLMALARPGLSVIAADAAAAAAIAPLPMASLQSFMEEADAGAAAGALKIAARMKATAMRLDTFRRWGLTTLGEIAALPSAALSERMGQDGLVLQQVARGIDRTPLVPDPGVPRYLQSMELEWPIDALEPLSFVLARLLDPLSAALERADRGAAALRLDLRLVDRTTHTRMLQLPAAMRDAKVLRTLLLLDLESHPPAAAIDIVTLEIDPAPARIIQYSLLERAMPSVETLATLTARLGALVGENRCGSPALLDTYHPDSFEVQRFAPEVPRGAVSRGTHAHVHAAEREAAAHDRRPHDDLMLRRFRPPIAIRVSIERGRPVRIAIDRRGMPGGGVQQQAGPWRTSGAWWTAGAVWDRDEWDVALSDGSLCRIFRDRLADTWFLEGVLD